MACLRHRQEGGRSARGSVQGTLDGTGRTFWEPHRQFDNPRRLQGLLQGPQEGWLFRQHHKDRSGIAASLPAPQVWRCRSLDMDTASKRAARSLAFERAGPRHRRSGGHPAHKAFCHFGAGDWRTGGRDTRFDMAPGRLRARYYRLPPCRTNPDKQTAHDSADEHKGTHGAGRGPQGATHGPCNRIWGEADCVGQEGHPAAIGQGRDTLQPTHAAAYLRSVDGAGQCADAAHKPVSGAHIATDDRAGIRSLQSTVYAGCERCNRLLMYSGTYRVGRYMRLSAWKIWWAVTVSNRRPSRCKQGVLTANCGFLAIVCEDFANLCPFRFTCVPL